MPRLPDISAYYTPQLALQEEVQSILHRSWQKPLDFILPRLAKHGIKQIVEFGCRSGLLAAKLPTGIAYSGLDTNTWMLDRARDRCEGERHFQFWDARNWTAPEGTTGGVLAMAWGVLKHYSLDEWDRILANLLNSGQYAAFNVQLVEGEPFDNGEHFHHTFITETRIDNVLRACGHGILAQQLFAEWEVDGKKARDMAYWTVRTSDVLKRESENIKDVEWDNPEAPAVSDVERVAKKFAEKYGCSDPISKDIQRITEVMPELIKRFSALYGLEIDGAPQTLLHRFALRFVETDTGHQPVLYLDGRRVTKAWRLKIDWTNEADSCGDNANTAERK